MAEVLEVNEDNFDEVVLQSDKLALLDMWAEWCGPCKLIHPIMRELADDYDGRAIMTSVDVEGSPSLTGKYRVRNIPTVLFFKNGEVVDKVVGAVPKAKFVEKIEKYL
jgi:thioredoxin 1